MTPALRYLLLIASALVLQRGVFSQLRLADAAPDLLLLLAVAAGVAGGSERGAIVGFFAGLSLDLLLPTPMGLAALSYLVAGAAAGRLRAADNRSARWRVMAVCAGGCALGVVVFALLGTLLGERGFLDVQILAIVGVVALTGAVLGPLAVRLCRWADGDPDRLRPALR